MPPLSRNNGSQEQASRSIEKSPSLPPLLLDGTSRQAEEAAAWQSRCPGEGEGSQSIHLVEGAREEEELGCPQEALEFGLNLGVVAATREDRIFWLCRGALPAAPSVLTPGPRIASIAKVRGNGAVICWILWKPSGTFLDWIGRRPWAVALSLDLED